MAAHDPKAGRDKRFDLLMSGAALMLLLAAAFGAYPALKAGPTTAGGLLLLTGLAGITILALFGFGAVGARGGDEPANDGFLEALDEPAAICAADGRILAANTSWTRDIGPSRRLPRSAAKPGSGAATLFSAFNAARKGGPAQAGLKTLTGERPATVATLDERRFLVRAIGAEPLQIASPDPAVQAEAAESAPVVAAPALEAMPTTMDAFAEAAPFGAALLLGDDPFAAVISEANAALAELAGEKAQEGATFGDLIETASRLEAQGKAAQGAPLEVKLAHDPKRIVHLYLTRRDGGYVAYMVDVSAQKQIELQLAQSQKMQAIGQLAGGVAHDFNNLLMAIELRIDELLQRHPVGDPSYEGLSQIRQTGNRAADLVRKLLAFSRKQTVQRVTLDVGELISEFQVLLGRLLPEDVKLDTHYGKNLPQVRADKSQLETAVMNLVVNARDAVRGQKGGGVIRIETARLTKPEAIARGYADPRAPAGDVAMIEVSDNGPGIPPDVQSAIFDPFFTTKPLGEGTGLGLSTVYGIVKQADGWIHVDSTVGKGAAFRIFLPIYIAPAGSAPTPVPEAAKVKVAPRDLSGAGRILFVEDEDAVRVVAARLLRARGYEVIEAADGEEALLLAEEHAGDIDLMISDVIMPGMDGPTLLKKARGYLGNAPVMFISGYAEADFSNTLEGEEGVTFLPKPINIQTLAERVKQQLQAA
jgi:two-component system cell cycle sensor histidine kinase/response regulator CckA